MADTNTIETNTATTITMTEAEYHELNDSSSGVCLGCTEIRLGDTEPDAREYPCDACGENKVSGIEEALMMGNLEIS